MARGTVKWLAVGNKMNIPDRKIVRYVSNGSVLKKDFFSSKTGTLTLLLIGLVATYRPYL